jgi:putative chitinase
MEFDSEKFFSGVKTSLFSGKLSQPQVDGMNAILALPWERKRFAAYALATVFHECAQTMQPIVERGPKSYFDKYNAGTTTGARLGNTEKGDGYKYRGMGFVMLTGRGNYTKASTKLGVDLVTTPEKALELDISSKILYKGMMEGWFTSRKLPDYITDTKTDFFNARRIINGLDRAALIEGYAKQFNRAFS